VRAGVKGIADVLGPNAERLVTLIGGVADAPDPARLTGSPSRLASPQPSASLWL
jgi:hypothetical protein